MLEVIDQPQQANRVHVKVAIRNQKRDKEDKKNFKFYNAASYLDGFSIHCDQCDDSMRVLFVLLRQVRGQQ